MGELLVLMALALLVFGPDKLPQVTAQATHWIRQLREQAASARADLADAVDLDSTGLKDLADLHPKRLAASVLAPVEEVRRDVASAASAATDSLGEIGSAARGTTGSPAVTPSTAPATPPAGGPPHPSAPFDPDAT